ncbi:transposase [Streptomyces sp. NPDC096012]|uniref:transposase n=1 Tax=Streptomyces sp. NPDC096012 TaxID=3155684 RepID=UPI003369DD2A
MGSGTGSAAGAGWPAGRGGRPEGYCHRQLIDAVRYPVDNGIKWRAMPPDCPPWDRVYAFFVGRTDARPLRELTAPCEYCATRPTRRARSSGCSTARSEGSGLGLPTSVTP